MQVEFGYYPADFDIQTGAIRLASLPGLASKVAAVRSDKNTHDGWMYAPHQRNRDIMTGVVSELPQPSRIFGLPKTHVLEHASPDSAEHLHFLVWCVGFFTGFPLTTLECGCQDAAPVEIGKMNDFFVPEAELPDAVALSEQYWRTYSGSSQPRMPKRLTGIIHSLFLSHDPTAFPYERFTYLYMTLDACYRQATDLERFKGGTVADIGHGKRIRWMCDYFSMPDPHIQVFALRNDTFHEALFFDEPLGFMSLMPDAKKINRTLMYMRNLVCRLIVALMDAPCRRYIESDPKTRHTYDVTFP
jgi:hypothetical protein